MRRFEEYLDGKRLKLNVGKTKRFKKGGSRVIKRNWRWKGKVIVEVKEHKYLGYVIQRNEKQEAQVKDRIRRTVVIMGQVWGIGMKRDWGRRL